MDTKFMASVYHQQNYCLTPTKLPIQSTSRTASPRFLIFSSSISSFLGSKSIALDRSLGLGRSFKQRKRKHGVVASSNAVAPFWDSWKPEESSSSPSFSDIIWPSVGAFAAMAILGKMDQILGPKGISMTIAPLGAVSAILFVTPSAPAARKYNVFMAQIGCASIGVLAFSIFGPGWLARSAALAASVVFMICTRSTHPPAASLPLMFIDGVKFHHLNCWYALFPGATGCIILCLIASIFPLTPPQALIDLNNFI